MKRHLLTFATLLAAGGAMAQTAAQLAAATADAPVAVTLQNPSYDSNNNTGWQGSAPVFGYGAAEFFDTNYEYYQDVTVMPAGIYAVSVQGFYRAGSWQASFGNFVPNARLFAGQGDALYDKGLVDIYSTGVTAPVVGSGEQTNGGYYIPDNMYAASEYFAAGYYQNRLFVGVAEAGNVRIGLKKDVHIVTEWTIFDNWQLLYYGNSADAVKLWVAELVQNYAADYGRGEATDAVVDAYNSSIGGISAATTIAAVKEAEAAVAEAKAAVDDNKAAWVALKLTIESLKALYGTEDYDAEYVGAFNDVYDRAVAAAADIAASTLTTDEVLALNAAVEAAKNEMALHPTRDGVDMTALLVNPAYEQGYTGWTVNAATGGSVVVQGSATNKCFEAWNNAEFDIYQEVSTAPLGVYEIEVQGFYRYLRDDNAWNAYVAQESQYVKKEGVPVYVYMNNNATPFVNIFTEPVPVGELYTTDGSLMFPVQQMPYEDGNGYWYPNEMYNSALAFEAGMYKQSAFGLVARDGDVLRLGVKGASNQGGDSWVIWDNFKLTYRGFKADVIKPVLEEAVADVEGYATLLMGKTEHAGLTKALSDAASAIETNDGEAMFHALNALYDLKDLVIASKDLFLKQEVAAEVERLANAIETYGEQRIAKATLAAAKQLQSDIAECAIYENAQAEDGTISRDVETMIRRLEASVANFEELHSALNQLNTAIQEAKETGVSKDDTDAASDLYSEGTALYLDIEATDEQVEEKLGEIYQTIAHLNYLVTGIADVNSAEGLRMEYFTANGQRVSGVKHGLVIVKTTRADGTVVTRKLSVK